MSQGLPEEAVSASGGHQTAADRELVTTLFDLGRQVTAVLDLDDLLQQLPRLIRRLIPFEAFAVYLLDERRGELRAAYSVGYPEPEAPLRIRLGEGLVGAAVASEQPLLVNDLRALIGKSLLPVLVNIVHVDQLADADEKVLERLPRDLLPLLLRGVFAQGLLQIEKHERPPPPRKTVSQPRRPLEPPIGEIHGHEPRAEQERLDQSVSY